MHKPEPEIYRLAAERVGAEPGACLFVDDLRENCDGAEAVGMTAIRHREPDGDDRAPARAHRRRARRRPPLRSSRRDQAPRRRARATTPTRCGRLQPLAEDDVREGDRERRVHRAADCDDRQQPHRRRDREQGVGDDVEGADHDQHRRAPRPRAQRGRTATSAATRPRRRRRARADDDRPAGTVGRGESRIVKKKPKPSAATSASTIERRAHRRVLGVLLVAEHDDPGDRRRPGRPAGSARAPRPGRGRRRPGRPRPAPRSARRCSSSPIAIAV